MSKRGLGLVLVLTFAVAIGALVEDVRLDRYIAAERTSLTATIQSLESAQLTLAHLRAAQAGYLALGQGPHFWLKRGGELAAQLESSIGLLQSSTNSPDARTRYDAAIAVLGALNSLDQKARDDIASGDRYLASDVIFSDSIDTAQRLAEELSAARNAEHASSEARVTTLRIWRFEAAAGGMLALLGAIWLLAFRRPSAVQVQAAEVAFRPGAFQELALNRISEAPAERPRAELANAASERTETIRPEPVVVSAPVSVALPAVNLSDAADVCVDLGRVLDGQDMPPLLERAARVLDAKGLVLWVADESRTMLRPSLSHGYPAKVLQKLGPLPIASDNVTSLAFRSMQPQALGGAAGSTNAIAVPLITSTGCVGVLAAEITLHTAAADRLAIAKMFAAQLATLVTPGESVQKTAQG